MNSKAAFKELLFTNLLEIPSSGTLVDHVAHLLGGASASLRAQPHAVSSASMGIFTLLFEGVWCLAG